MSKPHAANSNPHDPANPELEQELRKLGIKGDRQFPGILELIAEFEMRAYERGVLDGHVRQHDKDMLEMEPEAYERGRRDELRSLWEFATTHDSVDTTTEAWKRLKELEKGKPDGE